MCKLCPRTAVNHVPGLHNKPQDDIEDSFLGLGDLTSICFSGRIEDRSVDKTADCYNYNPGSKNMVSNVENAMPPMTAVANGR